MAAANLVGGAESGPVWSPAIFSREQTRAFIAIISKRNIAELLGEGGPRPSLAKHDLRVRRGPKGFGASTNDTESSEHCRALHGSAERAAPTSVPFLAAQEPFGLGVRLVRSRSASEIKHKENHNNADECAACRNSFAFLHVRLRRHTAAAALLSARRMRRMLLRTRNVCALDADKRGFVCELWLGYACQKSNFTRKKKKCFYTSFQLPSKRSQRLRDGSQLREEHSYAPQSSPQKYFFLNNCFMRKPCTIFRMCTAENDLQLKELNI
ncbi:hypothetical protein HPB47_027320 [Ixodes persulcatus]|uniref:Uncharacterized protein n=1 Tax=Ixodes persulcatus TaxID=34615 RepID=A0AC60PYN1_IXOPE|nr:hypothetical protein HPB47_027320 [Ixodes persulcatus]